MNNFRRNSRMMMPQNTVRREIAQHLSKATIVESGDPIHHEIRHWFIPMSLLPFL